MGDFEHFGPTVALTPSCAVFNGVSVDVLLSTNRMQPKVMIRFLPFPVRILSFNKRGEAEDRCLGDSSVSAVSCLMWLPCAALKRFHSNPKHTSQHACLRTLSTSHACKLPGYTKVYQDISRWMQTDRKPDRHTWRNKRVG